MDYLKKISGRILSLLSNNSDTLQYYDRLIAYRFIRQWRLFDLEYYNSQIEKDLSYKKALLNFLKSGWKKGYSPNPLFNTAYYLKNSPDVKDAGINPFLHFLSVGFKENRQPHPTFDMVKYRNNYLHNGPQNPFIHYINHGYKNPFSIRDIDTSKNFGTAYESHLNINRDRAEKYIASLLKTAEPTGKRNIILSSHDASRTGAPKIILNIAQRLTKDKLLNCFIIIGKDGPLIEEFSQYGCIILLEDLHKRYSDIDIMGTTARLLKNYSPEWSLCNSIDSEHSYNIMTSLYTHEIPVISLIHEFSSLYPEETIKRLRNHSNSIVFPSKTVEKSYQDFLDKTDDVHIIPQGTFQEHFPNCDKRKARQTLAEELSISEDTFVFLGSGFIGMRKGIDFFITVASMFKRRHPHVKAAFVWLGAPYENGDKPQSYYHWIKHDQHHSQQDNFFLLGERKNVNPYFAAADCFLMLSRHDPFPCVVLEAMQSGLPVICFKEVIGSAEIISHENGTLVDYLDFDTATEACYKYSIDKKLCQNHGQKASELIRTEYSYEAYVAKLRILCQKTPLRANEKTIYLHVGMPKTGTTALQSFFRINKENLIDKGIYYPQTGLRGPGHMQLGWAFDTYTKSNDDRENLLELLQKLKEEIEASGCNKILISCERFIDSIDCSLFKSFFEGYTFKPIFYLRCLDIWAESLYKQIVKSEWTRCSKTFPVYLKNINNKLANMARKTENLKQLCPEGQNIHISIYDKSLTKEQGLYKDFARVLGIGDISYYQYPDHQDVSSMNYSLSTETTEFIRKLNHHNIEAREHFDLVDAIRRLMNSKDWPEAGVKQSLLTTECKKIIQQHSAPFISKFKEDDLINDELDFELNQEENLFEGLSHEQTLEFCNILLEKADLSSNIRKIILNIQNQPPRRGSIYVNIEETTN